MGNEAVVLGLIEAAVAHRAVVVHAGVLREIHVLGCAEEIVGALAVVLGLSLNRDCAINSGDGNVDGLVIALAVGAGHVGTHGAAVGIGDLGVLDDLRHTALVARAVSLGEALAF